MKSAILYEKGFLDGIEIQESSIPDVQSHQILVRVQACGMNPVDWKGVISGFFEMPYIIGSDFSGIIEKVGDQVSSFHIGDEIMGSLEWAKQGAFAEYLVTEEKYITPKPRNLSCIESSAVPLASLTAWQGLFDHLKLQSGEKILIQAAAGGVGLFALQFAKWAGAYVVAVASEKNAAFLKSLGADEVFDYKEAFSKLPADFDAVFDSMASSEQTIPLLQKGGRYISITAKPNPELATKYGIAASNFLFHSNATQLLEISKLIEQGIVQIFIDKTFAFTEVKKALKYQQEGHSRGKNVLVIQHTAE